MKFYVHKVGGSVVELEYIAANGLHYFRHRSVTREYKEPLVFTGTDAELLVKENQLIPVEEKFL